MGERTTGNKSTLKSPRTRRRRGEHPESDGRQGAGVETWAGPSRSAVGRLEPGFRTPVAGLPPGLHPGRAATLCSPSLDTPDMSALIAQRPQRPGQGSEAVRRRSQCACPEHRAQWEATVTGCHHHWDQSLPAPSAWSPRAAHHPNLGHGFSPGSPVPAQTTARSSAGSGQPGGWDAVPGPRALRESPKETDAVVYFCPICLLNPAAQRPGARGRKAGFFHPMQDGRTWPPRARSPCPVLRAV